MEQKWYEWQHIAGTVIPFVGSSTNIGFGYLEQISYNGSHPIIFFSEFPEDTTLVASSFDNFFNLLLVYVELSLLEGNNVEIDIIEWLNDTARLSKEDPLFVELANSNDVNKIIDSIKRS